MWDVYAGTNQVHLPKAELQVTEILSIEFWAAVSELTMIYYSNCYLYDTSTARANNMALNIPLLQHHVFGSLNHGLNVTKLQLMVLPGSVNFWSGYGLDQLLTRPWKH